MPVLFGFPPVIGPTRPGNESEGKGVCACVNSTPLFTSLASADEGWWLTYHARSDWCRPSTERNSTCFAGALPTLALDPAAVVAATDAAATRPATRPRIAKRLNFNLLGISPATGPQLSRSSRARWVANW